MSKLSYKIWDWECLEHVKYKVEGWIMGVTNVAIWFNDHVLGFISFVGFCVYVYWRSIKTKHEALKAKSEAEGAKLELEIKREQLKGYVKLTDSFSENLSKEDKDKVVNSRNNALQ